jgi:hypothetical protein
MMVEMMRMDKSISLERLAEYCRAYDEIYSTYAESEYEGDAALEFIFECEGLL